MFKLPQQVLIVTLKLVFPPPMKVKTLFEKLHKKLWVWSQKKIKLILKVTIFTQSYTHKKEETLSPYFKDFFQEWNFSNQLFLNYFSSLIFLPFNSLIIIIIIIVFIALQLIEFYINLKNLLIEQKKSQKVGTRRRTRRRRKFFLTSIFHHLQLILIKIKLLFRIKAS